ncbi:DUF3103 family protein [Chitinimonas sp. BJB300]|uniref:DUF3103 family protein n=1 Tax=Chitinimonas sp. BJB300 TaxID=1559339 RepID=UPI000C0C773E|nr:DUF3103 family protein [Chitinimonas sp. BJB300]PHV10041.1 hypothetical protein CSQ89_18315 [Chitinimonas sp. BJB300]TSJ91025.1 DUF3103 family protein [Chitinimonas sp. BJB300]
MKFTAICRQLSIGALCFAAFTSQAEELRPEFSAEMLNGMIVQPSSIDIAKRQAAMKISQMLANPLFAASLEQQLNATPKKPGSEKAASLHSVLDDFQQRQLTAGLTADKDSETKLRQLDKTVLDKKGLTGVSKGLLEVRLYQPGKQQAAVDLSQTLVAFEPAGDDKQWRVVEAYDRNGKVHRLDARTAPQVPVLVADIDGREDLRAGIALANRTLVQQGMQNKQPGTNLAVEPGVSDLPGVSTHQRISSVPSANTRHSSGYIETAKLDRIRVKDDMEPWVSGAAEIYAMVSGVQPDQSKAQIELVEMPYLDYDGQTYSPNQILFFWSNYRFAAANVQFFEHDDNTNYKDLVVAITSGVEKLLGVFKPEYAIIATVAGAIIQVMPSKWFENGDDYLDSFYTLEKNRTYTDWLGAGSNVTMTLTPYRLKEQ